MSIVVKLQDIIDGMEAQSGEYNNYLNKKTGEVVGITLEELWAAEDEDDLDGFLDWQQERIKIAEEIITTRDYIPLPSEYDIHEYNIMEKFCLAIEDKELSDRMYYSIKGSGAFRRFKDNIYRYDIADDWYDYRAQAFRRMAIDWCERNDIEYS